MATKHTKAKELSGYSFLVVFMNDNIISKEEMIMMEKIALRDNVVDDEEKEVFRTIFSRVEGKELDPDVIEEIARFRKEYEI